MASAIRRAWRIEHLEDGSELVDVERALSRRGRDRAESPRSEPEERGHLQHAEFDAKSEHLPEQPIHLRGLRRVASRNDLLDDRAPRLSGDARHL